MISFSKFPEELRFDDTMIRDMTLYDISEAFKCAELYLYGNELTEWQQCMWSAIARVRHNPATNTMQSVLNTLEEYKRRLGRQYDATHDIRTMLKYNEIERDIRWLCGQYSLRRNSKPYYLGPKY